MARKSLRPHLNQIRTWTRQGRTDAWVAHQLEVTVQQIEVFKRENGLIENGESDVPAAIGHLDFDDEIDLRAEDDALIAAELEAAEAARAKAQEEEEAQNGDEEDSPAERRRRRGRRGGRGRRGAKPGAGALEGTFEHGEEGYGLWLDPAIVDDPVYAEHWAGHRPVEIVVEENRIVIRRAGAAADEAEAETPAEEDAES